MEHTIKLEITGEQAVKLQKLLDEYEEVIKLKMTEEESVQFQKLLNEYLERIKELREQIAKDQVEIEQYGAQTQAIIDRMNRKAA